MSQVVLAAGQYLRNPLISYAANPYQTPISKPVCNQFVRMSFPFSVRAAICNPLQDSKLRLAEG